MILAPRTVLTYPLDGANRDFAIPFEYLARKFVQVTLIGADRKTLTLNVDYRFTQRTIITLSRSWGPADGYQTIELRRYTSATERLVDFSDGSVLRATDLNTSALQALHISEEGRDIATDTIGVDANGNLDARGRKIVNLLPGLLSGDAVSLQQIANLAQQMRFLTPKQSLPTLRDDGNPLQVGDRVLITTEGLEYIYKPGGMWSAVSIETADLTSTDKDKGAALVGNAAKVVNLSSFGARPGTDVTDKLVAASNRADTLRWTLVNDVGDVYITAPVELPMRFHGNDWTITGGEITANRRKHLRWESFSCTTMKHSGVWHAAVRNINVSGRWTIDGNDSDFGTFWNTFTNIRCGQIVLDVRYQAVNQNQFDVCMGNTAGQYGLLITDFGATSSPTNGIMEAHNNTFRGCDFSHSMGCANDIAVRNQDNLLLGCYFEHGALPTGKWTVFMCQIDGQSLPLVPSRSHVLGMTDVSPATFGDSISMTQRNCCVGGDWTVRKKGGVPKGFSSNNASSVVIPIPEFITPWGRQSAYGGKANNGYQYLSVDFMSVSGKFSAVLWLYLPDYDMPKSISIMSNGKESYRAVNLVAEGNGVFLLRVSGEVEKNVPSSIRIYQSLTQVTSGQMYIGAAYVTSAKAAVLPSFPVRTVAANPQEPADQITYVTENGIERKRGVVVAGYGATAVRDIRVDFGDAFQGSDVWPSYVLEVNTDYQDNFIKHFIAQGSVSSSGFTVRVIVGGSGEFAGAVRWTAEA